MVESTVGVEGVITFWSPREWTRRAQLVEGLTMLGLNKHVPQPRTPAAAFRDALDEQFGRGHEVHRLKNGDSYEVLRLVRQDWPVANVREVYTLGRIDATSQITFRPWVKEQDAVVDAYNRHLGLVRGQQVGECLTAIIAALGGTRLRPSGGIYWLPGHRLGEWRPVADVVEGAGHGGPNKVYLVGHSLGPDEVRAVHDAVVAEVGAEAARIQRELDCDDPDKQLGERALATRKATLLDLRRTIREYEGLLGVGLEQLARQVEAVEMAAAKAALMAAIGA